MPGEDLDGVHAARVLAAGIDIRRKCLLTRAVAGTGRRERIVVGVVDPAVLRIDDVGRFIEGQHAVPFGRRVAAVNRLGPVKLRIALRNEVRVEVGDVAAGIRVERVVRRVGVDVHHLLVLVERARLGARVRLDERLHRLFHQPHADPLAVGLPHDRAAMGPIGRELALRHAVRRFVGHHDLLRDERLLFGADLIGVAAVGLLRHRLEVLVDVVDAARRVHPAGLVVEALVDEELSPRQRAVGVQAFLADHVRFLAEEERGVRVDQQHRLAGGGVRAGDRDAVRTGRLNQWFDTAGACLAVAHDGSLRGRRRTVERFELRQVDALDVAADAALAEAERHPRLELRDHARLHVRVRRQVIVEAVSPRVHQRLQPLRALVVFRLQIGGIDEELHAQVAPDLLLALSLGEPALRVDEVGLDAVEIVFRLRVHQAEHHVGVGLAVDVRHAPVVTDDRDALRALLNFATSGLTGCGAVWAAQADSEMAARTMSFFIAERF